MIHGKRNVLLKWSLFFFFNGELRKVGWCPAEEWREFHQWVLNRIYIRFECCRKINWQEVLSLKQKYYRDSVHFLLSYFSSYPSHVLARFLFLCSLLWYFCPHLGMTVTAHRHPPVFLSCSSYSENKYSFTPLLSVSVLFSSCLLKKLFIYLFLVVLGFHCCTKTLSSSREWGLLSFCSLPASHCGGFSCCKAQALGVWDLVVAACWLSGSLASVVAAQGLLSCDLWALEHAGSSRCSTRAQ